MTNSDRQRVLRFEGAVRYEPRIEDWFQTRGHLGSLAQRWFEVMRRCGADVREVLHDGHPTACIGDAAFAYVNVFSQHVNVGFFRGAELSDPFDLLVGNGRYMRHVKLLPDTTEENTALVALITAAYRDMQSRFPTPST